MTAIAPARGRTLPPSAPAPDVVEVSDAAAFRDWLAAAAAGTIARYHIGWLAADCDPKSGLAAVERARLVILRHAVQTAIEERLVDVFQLPCPWEPGPGAGWREWAYLARKR